MLVNDSVKMGGGGGGGGASTVGLGPGGGFYTIHIVCDVISTA